MQCVISLHTYHSHSCMQCVMSLHTMSHVATCNEACLYIHTTVAWHEHVYTRNVTHYDKNICDASRICTHTGWHRLIGSLIFVGHFRKSDLYLVALLWTGICNLGDPMSLRHPVRQRVRPVLCTQVMSLYTWMSRVSVYMNESCLCIHEWVMSLYTWMSHVSVYMNESCLCIHEWVMSLYTMSHVSIYNQSRLYTYKCACESECLCVCLCVLLVWVFVCRGVCVTVCGALLPRYIYM